MTDATVPVRSASARTAEQPKETAAQKGPNGTPAKSKTAVARRKNESSIVKRIKKLFGGKTKKKKDRKATQRQQQLGTASRNTVMSATNSIYTRDDKTIQFSANSQPDTKSLASTAASKKSQAKSYLQVVLLLVDPVTIRFELLQLEFDSVKAKVSDVLRQIPVAVTEDIIRTVQYNGVCDATSDKKTNSDKLSGFCKSKQVLVAIPEDLGVADAIRLARPILGDDKVVSMLESIGIDMTPWKRVFAKSKSADADASHSTVASQSTATSTVETTSGTHQSDNSKSSSTAGDPKNVYSAATSRSGPSMMERGHGSLFWIVLLALVAAVVQMAQQYFTSPVQAGKVLPPGTWRTKCGIIDHFADCDEKFLEVTHEGHVNVYDAQNNLVMTMHGNVCGDTKRCTDGLLLSEDGDVSIGGKRIKTARAKSAGVEIVPWPFTEMPNISVKPEPSFKMFQPV